MKNECSIDFECMESEEADCVYNDDLNGICSYEFHGICLNSVARSNRLKDLSGNTGSTATTEQETK